MRFACWTFAVSMLAAFAAATPAQEPQGEAAEAEEAATAEEAAGPEAAEARQQFDKSFEEYKQIIMQIEELRAEFQEAEENRRQQINQQLQGLVDQAKGKMDAMVESAVEVYRADPNAPPQVTQLLESVAQHYVAGAPIPNSGGNVSGGDQYNKALPVLNALIEGGHQDSKYLVWGFLAAVATNDFELAEKRLAQMREAGVFEQPPTVQTTTEEQTVNLALMFASEFDAMRQRWEQEKAIRQAEAEADDLPRVKIETTKGDILVELFENEAPQTVANFVTLVKQGYYDGIAFHRVLPQFMAQGGDPTSKQGEATGGGGPGYNIPDEHNLPQARKHFRGVLSMANTGQANTGGSQFFLTFIPTVQLDNRHAVFGRVVEGMDVVGEIQRRDPASGEPMPAPDRIIEATVVRDRGHEYQFEKLPE